MEKMFQVELPLGSDLSCGLRSFGAPETAKLRSAGFIGQIAA